MSDEHACKFTYTNVHVFEYPHPNMAVSLGRGKGDLDREEIIRSARYGELNGTITVRGVDEGQTPLKNMLP